MVNQDSGHRPVCVLPGCISRAPRWGAPCADCLELFDEHLQPTFDTAPLTREQLDERDRAVRAGYADQDRIQSGQCGVRR